MEVTGSSPVSPTTEDFQLMADRIKKEQKPHKYGAFYILFKGFFNLSSVEVLEQIALRHLPELTLMLQPVAKSVFLLA